MALSVERQFAKLVRSYARLKKLYEASQRERVRLGDEVSDLKLENRRLRAELRQDHATHQRTLPRVLAGMQYALNHLHEAGDVAAAERMADWMDDVRAMGIPLVNARPLIDLLDEWMAAMPCDDLDVVGALWMKTTMQLEELRGGTDEEED